MVLTTGARWLVAVLAVLCLVLLGSGAPADSPAGRTPSAGPARDVVANRVMTWNICNPCDESNADRAAAIAAFAPQVIGLQEACVRDVDGIRDELESRYGLVYQVAYGTVLHSWSRCGGVPWNPGGYGEAILSAAPMTDRVHVEYPDGGSEDRGYMAVTTRVDGAAVRVFNTHLAERRQEAVRTEQTRVLAAKVAPYERAVVLGDFNAQPDAAELAPMWALAADADPRCLPSRASACEPTTDWSSRFDYVFLRNVAPLAHGVRPTPVSDHHLLHADLDLDHA
ncbi:endonuclease/exonuclease/phosphatase family protein [Streptomyces sp. NPDC021608]|uniref:endonuclease/exonuclease/phosphatase family protein n=1 Tax=Streptomyces sp. NPDC021608 TaxID=3154903 RepID=UPI00340B9E46